MLKEVLVRRFKSLSRVKLRLGGLNLLIGTNASGKSNFLDALRVLQGVGYGLTVNEIFDGKPKSASSVAWDGIRGGSAEALQRRTKRAAKAGSAVFTDCSFSISLELGGTTFLYAIRLEPSAGRVYQEHLVVDGQDIYKSTDAGVTTPTIYARIYSGLPGRPKAHQYERHRPLLHQILRTSSLPTDTRDLLEKFSTALSNQQRLDLDPAVLRQYSQTPRAERMGERGENFAALVQQLMGVERTRGEYESWLQELTPAEVDHVIIKKGALGEPLFALQEGNRDFPAPVLSDGTLRFAAIAAALFQTDAAGLLLLEEIENGIHPTRLRLLVEVLRSRTASNGLQVLATTHSPMLLAWLNPEEYGTTFLCVRDPQGHSLIRPVSEIPEFQKAVQRTPFSDLFAEGWLESTA